MYVIERSIKKSKSVFSSFSALRLAIVVSTVTLAGCGSSGDSDSSQNDPAITFAQFDNTSIQFSPQPSSLAFEPQSFAEFYNTQLVELLEQRRADLNDSDSISFTNALDGLFLRSAMSIMLRGADGDTQIELQDFWLGASDFSLLQSEDFSLIGDPVGYQFSSAFSNSGLLFVQADHEFKTTFVDWVNNELTPEIMALDFSTDFAGLRTQVAEEYGLLIPFPVTNQEMPDPSVARLAYIENISLSTATLSVSSNEAVTAFFIDRPEAGGESITQVEAIRYEGQFRQLPTAEGLLTLVPILASNKSLAVIQPELGQFENYIAQLPSLLREVLQTELISSSAIVPVLEDRRSNNDYQELLKSLGLTLPFNRALADFTNLDRGGQYVSYFDHASTLSLSSQGVSLDSSGGLMTVVNPENIFFNTDVDLGGGFGSNHGVISISSRPFDFCNVLDDFASAPKLHPFALALVDSITGVIDYIAEINSVDGNPIFTDSCPITGSLDN